MFLIRDGNDFLLGVNTVQGQPMAQVTPDINSAKKWQTRAAAEKFLAKWAGAGVGITGDEIVEEMTK